MNIKMQKRNMVVKLKVLLIWACFQIVRAASVTLLPYSSTQADPPRHFWATQSRPTFLGLFEESGFLLFNVMIFFYVENRF